MDLKTVFEACAKTMPDRRAIIHSTSLALRRGGVETMEELSTLFHEHQDELESMRDIGPRRLRVIQLVLLWNETQEEPSSRGE